MYATIAIMLAPLALVSALNCTKNYFENVGLVTDEHGNRTYTADISQLHRETFLSITSTKIPILCEDAITGLIHLEKLYLNKLSLVAIKPKALKNLPNLKVLKIRGNELQMIEEGVFNHLLVESIDLSHNLIWVIDDSAFNSMHTLKHLDLSNNRLKRIKKIWFLNSPNINHLLFANNHVSWVQKKIFKHIRPTEKFVVDLSSNDIDFVQLRAFANFEGKGTFNLTNNSLRSIPDVFGNTTGGPFNLILEDNEFKCVDPIVISNVFKQCQWVNLVGNPISCRCSEKLKKFVEANNNTRVTYEVDPWCQDGSLI